MSVVYIYIYLFSLIFVCDFGIWGFWDFIFWILDFGFGDFGILGFWVFWDFIFWILGFWDFGILDFGFWILDLGIL